MSRRFHARLEPLLLVAALAATVSPRGTHAADPPGPAAADDAEARALFLEVVGAYRALDAYDDQGTFTVEVSVDGRNIRDRRPMRLGFARPGKIALDAGDVKLVGDGQSLATVIVPDRTYMVAKSAGSLAPALLVEGPLGAMLRGGPAGPSASPLLGDALLLDLLIGPDPAATTLENTRSLKLEADAEVAGHAVRVLLLEQQRGPAIRLFLDPKTKWLNRVEVVVTPGDLAGKVPGVALADASIAWESGPITTGPVTDDRFAFHAPEGYTEVAPIALGKSPAGTKDAEPEHELVGKPAPEFTVTVLDGPDKTQLLRKVDLAGKVVLLDFWATWCGPCLIELPEIAKLVTTYDEAKKGVVVVAISQDAAPDGPAPLRKLIEEKLAEEKLELIRGEVGKVALDPTHAVGQAFGVQGIPMVVLLDGKGMVRAVHIGARPEIGTILATEIDALLNGKAAALTDEAKPAR